MPEQVSFTINELTQGTVHGTGVFDVLMQAVKSHLKGEFEADRIRGTDYANAMAMAIGQVLSESTQYATQRAKLEAELKILDAQLLDIKAGTKIKDVEFDIQEFNRDFKLPKELELMEKDLLLKENQLLLSIKVSFAFSFVFSQTCRKSVDYSANLCKDDTSLLFIPIFECENLLSKRTCTLLCKWLLDRYRRDEKLHSFPHLRTE